MRVIGRILSLILLLSLSLPAWAKPAVTDARLRVEDKLTRVVISLSAKTEYRIFTLADPFRVVIDLNEVDWTIPAGAKLQGHGLVAAMRYGLFKVGTSRIVLDLVEPAQVVQAQLVPPADGEPLRLLVDLTPISDSAFRSSLKTAILTSSTNAPSSEPAKELADPVVASASTDEQTAVPVPPKIPLIVIDPGHGGVDPGAIGGSIMEKELTLAVAKALQAELLGTGHFQVVLTRTKDIYVPLRDRFRIAREKGADLFISLHADSHADSKMRGASVYTLSETASDSEAAALAAKENKSDIIAGVDLTKQSTVVTDILIDLAQRDTKNLSTRFAKLLVKELQRETLLLGKSHRYAGFAVLKAPDVPSVLLEMGYVSSDKDEALLTSEEHRARLAKAIRQAIDDYFEWQEVVRRS